MQRGSIYGFAEKRSEEQFQLFRVFYAKPGARIYISIWITHGSYTTSVYSMRQCEEIFHLIRLCEMANSPGILWFKELFVMHIRIF